MKNFMYIWKRKWLILVIAFILTAAYFARHCYNVYYTENMSISLIYPDSEKGKYPDGTRFNVYDMLSDDVLNAAIEGYNRDADVRITISDVINSIEVSEYLTADVLSKVDETRDLGIDYAYFANEFNVSFKPIRKINIENTKDMFGFKPYVDNKLFMENFYEAYMDYFMQEHAEKNIIKGLSRNFDTAFDYQELVDLYEIQINNCINYLNGKNAENGSFHSVSTEMTFNDLINAFRNLKNIQLQNLRAFTASSRLSKNTDEYINKLKVQNEKNELEYSKYKSEADLAKEAMNQYDHTFEENIVVAGISEEEGLYQTRAKTAYDTITKRAHDAGVKAESLYQDMAENERLIKEYSTHKQNTAEQERLFKIADSMMNEIKNINSDLVLKADTTVQEYLKTKSSDYIRRAVFEKSYINFSVIFRAGSIFVGTIVLMMCFITIKEFGSIKRISLIRKKKIKLRFDRRKKKK